MSVRQRDLGWAAGILEGEGTLRCAPITPHIAVVNTDLWVLERFQKIVNCGVIEPRKDSYPNRKKVYYWHTTYLEEAQFVAELLYDDLSPRRREKADSIISHVRKGYGPGQRLVYGDRCGKGHLLTPETTWVRKEKGGTLGCRQCAADATYRCRQRKL